VRFNGATLASGIYFYRLETEAFHRHKENDAGQIVEQGKLKVGAWVHAPSFLEVPQFTVGEGDFGLVDWLFLARQSGQIPCEIMLAPSIGSNESSLLHHAHSLM
jgi:hypothetical protein